MPRSKALSEQMRAESREQILRAARRLFAEYGYAGCKVSDIARQAGMSQGNVYWYFSSKEALLKAVLEDGFGTLDRLMAEASARPGTCLEKLDDLLDRYIAFGKERGEFTTIFLSLMAQGGVNRLRELGFDTIQIGLGYHGSVSAILAQGQSEGTILSDVDPNFLTMSFFAFFNGLMVTYAQDWMEVPPELIRRLALRLLGCSS